MFICGDMDYSQQYLLAEPKFGNSSCKVQCQFEVDSWIAMCQLTQNDQICGERYEQGNQVGQEKCLKLPETHGQNLCKVARKSSPVCKISCHDKWTKSAESGDDEVYQDDSVTFGQYQFYVFVILLIGGMAGTAVTTTLSDTVCIVQSKSILQWMILTTL